MLHVAEGFKAHRRPKRTGSTDKSFLALFFKKEHSPSSFCEQKEAKKL